MSTATESVRQFKMPDVGEGLTEAEILKWYVQPGDTVTVQYVEASHSSGKVIQSSWTSQPFQFTLGENQVIKGWDMGLVGMRVGGRRELIIPPSLGYGASSQGPSIAANDTLIFVVDLQKIG